VFKLQYFERCDVRAGEDMQCFVRLNKNAFPLTTPLPRQTEQIFGLSFTLQKPSISRASRIRMRVVPAHHEAPL
jgi:hypothetical protein